MAFFNPSDPLNLRDDNCQVEFRIPLRKRAAEPASRSLLKFSPLEVREKSLASEISDVIDLVSKKVAAFSRLVASLGPDYGEAEERARLELDCRRICEDADKTAAVVSMEMRRLLDGERQRLTDEFARFCQLFKASAAHLCSRYATMPRKMVQPLQTVAAVKSEQASFFTNRPQLFKNLDELADLHTEVSVALLKDICSADKTKPLILLTSSSDDLKCSIFETFDLGRVQKQPLGKVDFLRSNVPSFRTSSIVLRRKMAPLNGDDPTKPCCLLGFSHLCSHCRRSFCPPCETAHFSKLQGEIVEMSNLILLPSWGRGMPFVTSFVIPMVEERLHAEMCAFLERLGALFAGFESDLMAHLQSETNRLANEARKKAAILLANFVKKIATPLRDMSNLAVSLEAFVCKIKRSLYDCENRSSVTLTKLRDSGHDRRIEICALEKRAISIFSSLEKNSLISEIGPRLQDCGVFEQTITSQQLSRTAELFTSACPSYFVELVENPIIRSGKDQKMVAAFRRNKNDTLCGYRRGLKLKAALHLTDLFGDPINEPVGLTSIVPKPQTVFIAIVHSSDRISLMSPDGSVAQTFKVVVLKSSADQNRSTMTLSGEIVADEARCLLIFTTRFGDIFSLDFNAHFNGKKGRQVEPDTILRFSDRPCTGLAISSYRRELYTSRANQIEAYSLDDARFLFSWTDPKSDLIQLRCFQWVADLDSFFLVFTTQNGDILCRKKLTTEIDSVPSELIASHGWQLGRVSSISSVASDSYGNLVVCERGNTRLQVFSIDGAACLCPASSVGLVEQDPNSFFLPGSVVIVGKQIFVANPDTSQIFVFSLPAV